MPSARSILLQNSKNRLAILRLIVLHLNLKSICKFRFQI
ncbi:hypothetical protein CSUNSWCD_2385 [Campylobacter showae CSUNSWCD]|uniref:Uncharacterized protein n=1 Tax=Campylobacter showae CSUNSWCD TaxID=1244083 RepID=M5IPE5_9BACT|nr:hypothetical protein CSUNSWCD_2385 [Campylobacter showae CSUNSWCD]